MAWLREILSCCPDKFFRKQSQKDTIDSYYPDDYLKIFIPSISSPNKLLNYGGTMVELHCILSAANFITNSQLVHSNNVGLLLYGYILCIVTASWENILGNCTMLTMPGQFYHTICTIPPLCSTILNSITA